MNDEDLTAFMQHWTDHNDPITTDSLAYRHARMAFEAALAHRDKHIAELEAVVAKLPIYVDTGKRFVPGFDSAWVIDGDFIKQSHTGYEETGDTPGEWTWYTDGFAASGPAYSTREAAEAARSSK